MVYLLTYHRSTTAGNHCDTFQTFTYVRKNEDLDMLEATSILQHTQLCNITASLPLVMITTPQVQHVPHMLQCWNDFMLKWRSMPQPRRLITLSKWIPWLEEAIARSMHSAMSVLCFHWHFPFKHKSNFEESLLDYFVWVAILTVDDADSVCWYIFSMKRVTECAV